MLGQEILDLEKFSEFGECDWDFVFAERSRGHPG
jgi:hypothetical protein